MDGPLTPGPDPTDRPPTPGPDLTDEPLTPGPHPTDGPLTPGSTSGPGLRALHRCSTAERCNRRAQVS